MKFTKLIKIFVCALVFNWTLAGCLVSKKKYDDALSHKARVESEKVAVEKELNTLKEENLKSIAENDELRKEVSKSQKQIEDLKSKIKKLENETESLKTSFDNLSNNSGRLSNDLAKQRADLLKAEESLQLTKVENEKLLHDLKEREERVKALEKVIADKEKAVNELKNKISQALLNFKENDLSINVKNGKVYVSLAEQLLFKSGSISVDPKGIQALKQLAGVLKNSGDINVLVEGHTDDVPISKSSQYMNDNWDLSVMRATAIAKILLNNGVEPQKITAAGRGEHFPIDKGKTAESRQKNRRTEIILTPRLDELFQILESN